MKVRDKRVDVLACECGCTWLHTVSVNRYEGKSVPFGMPPTKIHSVDDMYVLSCAACGKTVFPKVSGYQLSPTAQAVYQDMRSEITGADEDTKVFPAAPVVEKRAKGTGTHVQDKRDTEE